MRVGAKDCLRADVDAHVRQLDLVVAHIVRALLAPVEEGNRRIHLVHQLAQVLLCHALHALEVFVAAGHAGTVLQCVHRLGLEHVGGGLEVVAEETDAHAVALEDERPARDLFALARSEPGDVGGIQRRDRVGEPLRAVVHEVVVGEGHGVDGSGLEDLHQLGVRAEVEVLHELLAARGERALEIDHA